MIALYASQQQTIRATRDLFAHEPVRIAAAVRQRSVTLLPVGLPSKSWIPNLPMLQLGGTLNALTLNGLTTEISLRLTPRGGLVGSGTWRVDDVYVDPWKVI